ncbi:MAG: beta-N-acetylhexosaminidase [Candidatus Hydrogenedentes bacterium]|nr:beta-N-acetylhexosaminidase [Candidatus Hydrogenedentota bacterium]
MVKGHVRWFLIAVLATAGFVAAAEEAEPSMPAVIPRPRVMSCEEGAFRLTPDLRVATAGKAVEARAEAGKLVARLKDELGLSARLSPVGSGTNRIVLRIKKRVEGVAETSQGDEGYSLRVTENKAELTARTDRGLFYGVQTLLDLVRRDGAEWSLPCCEIRDWPEFPVRGLLVAPGQGFMTIPDLKYRVDQMAANKLNLMHLHLTDEVLFTPRLTSYPALAGSAANLEQSYSLDDLRSFVTYSSDRKIGLVPEISMPGHATRILEVLPELRCKPKEGAPSMWAMCIGSESTYEFVERVVSELGPIFPNPLFHIGTDEIEFLDIPNCPVRISWRECAVCQDRIHSEHLKDERALFYYFIRRVDDITKRHGKRLMMWNDQIDIGKPDEVTVPQDVLMHFWRIAAPGRGPVENCDYLGFLKKGYQVINSYYPETYIDFHIIEKNLLKWNPYSSPEAPEQYRAQVLGGMMCAWSNHDMYRRVLPSAIPVFADRVWNLAPIDDPRAFAHALPRHIFGPSAPPELDTLFDAMGSIIPPLALQPDLLAHLKTSLPDMDVAKKLGEYRRLIAVLDREVTSNRLRFVPALTAYKESLQWLVEQSEKK